MAILQAIASNCSAYRVIGLTRNIVSSMAFEHLALRAFVGTSTEPATVMATGESDDNSPYQPGILNEQRSNI